MTIALILLIVLLYLFTKTKSSKRSIRNYITLITIILIVISGLRHEAVGNDTYAYLMHYDEIASASWHEVTANFWDLYLSPSVDGKDPGERVLIKFFTCILPNSRWFLFVVAFLLLIPLGVLVYRNSKTLETPCFFYVFYITLFYHYLPNSGIRQSLALSFLLVGYLLLQKDKVKWFLLFLFISTLIHKSCLIAIAMLFIYYIKHTKAMYYLGIVLFCLMLFVYRYVGAFLSMQSDVYAGYGMGTYYGEGTATPYMVILMILGLYLLGMLGMAKDQNAYGNRLLYGGSVLTLIFVVLVRLDPNLIRVTAYFGPWMGLMVPVVLKLWRPKEYKIYFILLLLIFITKAVISPDSYHFLWQEMELDGRYY